MLFKNIPINKEPLNTECSDYKMLKLGLMKPDILDPLFNDALIRMSFYVRDYADGNINDPKWSNMRVLAEAIINCIYNMKINVQEKE